MDESNYEDLSNDTATRCSNPDFRNEPDEEATALSELLDKHLALDVRSWTHVNGGWTFHLSDCTIHVFHHDRSYSKVIAESDVISKKVLDAMRVELRNVLDEYAQSDASAFAFATTLLQLTETAACHSQLWRQHTGQESTEESSKRGWNSREVQSWTEVLDNPHGVDPSSVPDLAFHLLGEPIVDICARIHRNVRVLHVEPVFRNDLVSRFLARQERIHTELQGMSWQRLRECVSPQQIRRHSPQDNIQGLAQEISRPSVTFHGAPTWAVQSIVRYGFVLPGDYIGETGKVVDTRCGQTYGAGIYSSPDPMFASAYVGYHKGKPGATQPADVPGMRLLVCATLMGRSLRCDRQRAWGVTQPLQKDAHSHVSYDRMEYIIFDSAQIIPCYVLHLDYGAKKAREEFERVKANPEDYFRDRGRSKPAPVNKWEREELFPGDVQRRKQERKAAAAKWFAYGFGPKEGSNIKVEQIADVSDDEEEYGDFQKARLDFDKEDELRERRMQAGGSWFDEYQTARKTRHQV